ncbi:transcription antitermination factor NusB [Nesterenkonia halophila]|uniref:RsmB/NOP family class I SAM-dependent RNA methyltransferase n=1 Tax=Nesterenkonia halophila TaxID=302044 RepID=UPI001291C37A|nr:transcription antitermination factor NusB [Nesterenkonia halophila]
MTPQQHRGPGDGSSGRPERRARQDRQDRRSSSADSTPRDAGGRQRSRASSSTPRRRSRSAPSERTRAADPARRTAFRVLRAVSADDAYANLVLPAEIRRAKLGRRDAGFATELTYGALRGQGTYDAILAACVDRPLDSLDAPVLDALRLGAHQLLGMRVDDHAAVGETVGLVRGEIGAGPSGLVNAVLRRVGAKSRADWIAEVASARGTSAGDDEALALEHAHPSWVVRALRQGLRLHGRGGPGELEELLAADNAAPEVHLVGLPELGERHLPAALEVGGEESPLLEDAVVFRGGDVGRLPGVREGVVRVQDIGSQWIARALTAAFTPETVDPDVAGERWLDLCAGPGGKAALLAALAAQQEAWLLANEPADHRAELVRQALDAVDSEAWDLRTGDGRTVGDDDLGAFDRILLDAPCTGLGALRRRPEARWRRSPSDLAELTVLQSELLDAAVDVLAPGGLLAYVTCSPHAAETVVQVDDVLRRHPELQLLDAHDPMAMVALPEGARLAAASPAPSTTPDGSETGAAVADRSRMVQLWPHVTGTDAMFFALLHRPA